MRNVLKTSCLIVYLLAAATAFVTLPNSVSISLQYAALTLLGLHALELLLMFNIVKRYPGPLLDSMALTLLFGLLHWLPLKKMSPR